MDSGIDEEVLLRRENRSSKRKMFGSGERKSGITTSSDELVRISEELSSKSKDKGDKGKATTFTLLDPCIEQ